MAVVCGHKSQRLPATTLHPQRDLGHRRRRPGADLRLHGVFSLGQIGFLAIGAYVSAILSMPPMVKQPMLLPGLPSWLATFDSTGWHPQVALLFASLIGGLVAALVGLLVGAPLMRLSGHYVAVATMGFLIIVNAVAVNWDEVTRGARGLSQIPTSTNPGVSYIWAAIAVYVALRLRNSPYGRAMIASRENLIAARGIGVNVLNTRLRAFIVSAFLTGVAGSLLAHQIGTVAPSAFYFATTFNIIIMVVLGGMGSISGAVIGAIIMTVTPELLRPLERGFEIGHRYGRYGLRTLQYHPGCGLHRHHDRATARAFRRAGAGAVPAGPSHAAAGMGRRGCCNHPRASSRGGRTDPRPAGLKRRSRAKPTESDSKLCVGTARPFHNPPRDLVGCARTNNQRSSRSERSTSDDGWARFGVGRCSLVTAPRSAADGRSLRPSSGDRTGDGTRSGCTAGGGHDEGRPRGGAGRLSGSGAER